MAEGLKPCPFCGKRVHIWKIDHPRLYRPRRNHPYCVACNNCDLLFGFDEDYGGIFDTEQEATEAWNRRANDGQGAAGGADHANTAGD